jgi:hypothetical protein
MKRSPECFDGFEVFEELRIVEKSDYGVLGAK